MQANAKGLQIVRSAAAGAMMIQAQSGYCYRYRYRRKPLRLDMGLENAIYGF